jgi:hypothetical protein
VVVLVVVLVVVEATAVVVMVVVLIVVQVAVSLVVLILSGELNFKGEGAEMPSLVGDTADRNSTLLGRFCGLLARVLFERPTGDWLTSCSSTFSFGLVVLKVRMNALRGDSLRTLVSGLRGDVGVGCCCCCMAPDESVPEPVSATGDAAKCTDPRGRCLTRPGAVSGWFFSSFAFSLLVGDLKKSLSRVGDVGVLSAKVHSLN